MDQHKVPKLSLKHFAGQNGEVWTYDKRSGKSWPASPARTGVEAHYYSIEREDGTMDTGLEAEMSKLEGEAAPIYEKLVAGELPRGTDRDIFGHFLGLMQVRTPAMRRMAADIHKFELETRMAFRAQHPETFKETLKRLAADGVDVSDPKFIRKSLLDMSTHDLVIPKSWVLTVIGHGEKYANVFLQMKWSLMRARHHYFITCDTPIFRAVDPKTVHRFYGDHGFLNKTAEVSFPLSTKRMLMMHWEVEAPYEVTIPKQCVENENLKRAQCAERELYAHIEHKHLSRLAAQFKDVHPLVRKSGFGGSTGFASVKVPRRWPKDKPVSNRMKA